MAQGCRFSPTPVELKTHVTKEKISRICSILLKTNSVNKKPGVEFLSNIYHGLILSTN